MERAWIEVDRDAIAHNVSTLKTWLAQQHQDELLPRLEVILKANAYGHGLLPVTQTVVAVGVERVGVATCEEGLELRAQGITSPIHLLTPLPPSQLEVALQNRLEITVDHPETLYHLQRLCQQKPAFLEVGIKLHLKFDTGMSRLGIREEQLPILLEALSHLPASTLLGAFTHFACAESDPQTAKEQLEAFRRLLTGLEARGICPLLRHAANSAALLNLPESHLDMVRCGLLVYGIQPFGPTFSHPLTEQLRPVLSLKARVVSVREVPAGTGVSYGYTFRTQRRTRIATLGIGYGDGYPLRLSNRGYVLLKGQRAPIVGRVCMDLTMVDVTDLPPVEVGDVAVLIGSDGSDRLRVEQLAQWAQTIPYEITTALQNRLKRVYLP